MIILLEMYPKWWIIFLSVCELIDMYIHVHIEEYLESSF